MTILDLARTDVVTATPRTTLQEAGELMSEKRVGSVVVVEGDRPVGVLTDRDLALELTVGGADPGATTVGDAMTPDPFTVSAGMGIYEAILAATDAGVRRIPVVDGDELVGIVTLDDITVLLARELNDVAGVIQGESPPY